MKNLKLIILAGIIFNMFSCKEYLDVVPDNVATLDYAFRMRSTALKYLFTCYSFMPDLGRQKTNPALFGADEMWKHPLDNASNFLIGKGQQNVNDPLNNFWDGENHANNLWTGISQCNIFLDHIGQVPDMESFEKDQWAAEVKVLKAYYYFYLLRMYGPIPIIKKNIPIYGSVQAVRVHRQPVDSVFSYITQLIDEARADLPLQVFDVNAELGRITLPIALALKAKVLVYAASPLFNGNTDYAGFKNSNGIQLFNQQFEIGKWKKAAQACKAAIDTLEGLGYKLYYFTPGPGIPALSQVTENQLNYRCAFTTEWNSGIIWAQTNNNTRGIQKASAPKQLHAGRSNRYAHGGNAGTMNIASLFYTENGLPIDEDTSWDFNRRFELRVGGENEKYQIKEGYTTAIFNFDRGPRFYASLGFDGGMWFGNDGTYDDKNSYWIEAKAGQFLSSFTKGWFPVTGYWVKKYINFTNTYTNGGDYNSTNYAWPIMRMSGLYLLYAEAMNEANGPSTEIYKYLNMIRARVGLPTVQDSWDHYSNSPGKYTTKDGLREIIHQERTAELAFEGQRFWDLRRWKTAPLVLNDAITGWDIQQEAAKDYYRKRVIFNQTFSLKDYFWPIKEHDLIVNNNLVQNPGW